jgi:putative Holliday junction resolvase
MALDVGDKRIGIAVSDPLGITAQGVETYRRTGDLDADTAYIVEKSRAYGSDTCLLFGMPRNMDGSYGFQAEKVRAFADAVIAHWDGEHVFYDERLTSAVAERMLIEADVSRAKRRKVVDKIAATVILQDYLQTIG